VSIPYDAAALLAYQAANVKGKETDAEFGEFKAMYRELAVAEVVLKKEQRKVLEMEQKVRDMQAKVSEKYPAAAVNGAKVTVEA
jgi:hypothetical protein